MTYLLLSISPGRFQSGHSRTGFEQLNQMVQKCAFVHDDVWDEMRTKDGRLDWDQFSTNAILLGAHTAVIDTMEGFGERYIRYLDRTIGLPQRLIIPKPVQESLVANLLGDAQSLREFSRAVQDRQLDISSFYSDATKGFDRLLASAASPMHTPRLHPSVDTFEKLNDKVSARAFLSSSMFLFQRAWCVTATTT